MMCSIPESKKKELSKLLLHLTKNLDITKTQFDNLSQSYMAVGKYLENDEQFADCHPVVSPQGSLRLGTIIQPINKDDDLDVDLVYRLSSKPYYWTQKTIKDKVGERLKSSERYAPMLDKEEGRRCWTLLYRDNADTPKEKYHMDILPCVSNSMYNDIFVRLSREAYSRESVEQIAIRITDKKSEGYATDTNEANWLKSNPRWIRTLVRFTMQANHSIERDKGGRHYSNWEIHRKQNNIAKGCTVAKKAQRYYVPQ